MEPDAEVSVNEFGNALGRPQLIGPTIGLGTLAEQLLKLLLLLDGQARRRAGMWLGRKSVGLLGKQEPAIQGTRADADDASDILYLVALLNGTDSLASPLFQRAGGSDRSTHTLLYREPPPAGTLAAQLA